MGINIVPIAAGIYHPNTKYPTMLISATNVESKASRSTKK